MSLFSGFEAADCFQLNIRSTGTEDITIECYEMVLNVKKTANVDFNATCSNHVSLRVNSPAPFKRSNSFLSTERNMDDMKMLRNSSDYTNEMDPKSYRILLNLNILSTIV